MKTSYKAPPKTSKHCVDAYKGINCLIQCNYCKDNVLNRRKRTKEIIDNNFKL